MEFYDLNSVTSIIKNGTGLNLAYAYEDLAFPEHSVFLLQFTKDAKLLYCYFKEDCPETEQKKIFKKLEKSANQLSFNILYKGLFQLEQKNDNINVIFL